MGHEVEVEYPLAEAEALVAANAKGTGVAGGGQTMRFLFLSGILAVREQEGGRLWF